MGNQSLGEQVLTPTQTSPNTEYTGSAPLGMADIEIPDFLA